MIIINKIRLAEIMKKLFNDMALLQKIMSFVSHNCGKFNTECIWGKKLLFFFFYNYRNYKIRLSLHNYILVMLVRYDFVRSNSF